MESRSLQCKGCGAPIEKQQIDIRRGLARCVYCGAVTDLGLAQRPAPAPAYAPAEAPAAGTPASARYERPPVPMPKNMQVSNESGLLQITYRWFNVSFVFMAFFAAFWNGFMLVWHGISLTSGAIFMSIFGLLHTAIGLGIAYYTLAGFINTTTIQAGSGWLTVQHGPLPWGGGQQLPEAELLQLYTKEHITHSRRGGVTRTYQVHAILRDKRHHKLLSGLSSPEQALYIEQELERYLGIADRPVRAELSREDFGF